MFDALGQPIGPSFGYGRGGKLYRYYVAARLLVVGKDVGPPDIIRRVGAEALEQVLVEQFRRLAGRPEFCVEGLPELGQRLELRPTDIQLVLSAQALFQGDHPALGFEALQGRLGPAEQAVWEPSDPPAVRIACLCA